MKAEDVIGIIGALALVITICGIWSDELVKIIQAFRSK